MFAVSVNLAHLDYGDDDDQHLIVLHGLFGSAKNWHTLSRRLAAGRRVQALDLRNHGSSPWVEGMTYDAMAGDVLTFMEANRLARADILGHSMGGKTAMALALTHPDRVSRLIVADIAPVRYSHSFRAYVRAMQDVDLDGITRRAAVEKALADRIPEPGIRSFLMQNLALDQGALSWRINLAGVDAAMDDLLDFPEHLSAREFTGPVLFVVGGASDYVREDHRPVIDRLFPHAHVAVLQGAGHWLHAERPDLFIDTVTEFLDRA